MTENQFVTPRAWLRGVTLHTAHTTLDTPLRWALEHEKCYGQSSVYCGTRDVISVFSRSPLFVWWGCLASG